MTDHGVHGRRPGDRTVIGVPAVQMPAPRVGFHTAPSEMLEDRLARDGKYLVNEGLGQSSAAGIPYYVSQRLAELFPEKVLVECAAHEFDPVRYASQGHCTMRMRGTPYPHWILRWEASDDPLGKVVNGLEQGWGEVEWDGAQFELLTMHWQTDRGTHRHSWIVADDRDTPRLFVRTVCTWQSQVRDELLVYDGGDWEKDEELFKAIKGSTFDNLVLPPTVADALREDVGGFFTARETYERYGVPWKRGILLVGPPGNGKTHAVKALINAVGQSCLYVKSFYGDGPSEYSIAEVFTRARTSTPCILVFEDLDSLVTKDNRAYFLNELDGFAGNAGILTLATSNHPERLDPAIADRPSRFDRKYHFTLPALAERHTYLSRWSASLDGDLQISPDIIDQMAECTADFSFAYLKELCLSALLAWMRTREAGSMAGIMRQQVEVLRGQMGSGPEKR